MPSASPAESSGAIPEVQVAVAVIARGPLLLAVYNPNWKSFTLPMTKRRLSDPRNGARDEEWVDAAARAATELLGRSIGPDEFACGGAQGQPLLGTGEYEQGDRDGVVKQYTFQAFGIALPRQPENPVVTGAWAEWFTAADFAVRRPVSATARFLVKELELGKLLPPW